VSAAKEAKIAAVAEIKEKLKKASSFVIFEYKGITVAEVTQMRNEYRKVGVEYHVYKNRLLQIALKDLGYNEYAEALNGANAIAISMTSDISSAAKIVLNKQKELKKLTIKCGQVEGSYLNENGVKSLATMPSREGLISQVLGLLQSPIAGFARVISAIAEKQA